MTPTSSAGPVPGWSTNAGGTRPPTAAGPASNSPPPTAAPISPPSKAANGSSKPPTTDAKACVGVESWETHDSTPTRGFVVGFNNPNMSWGELEARLSDGRRKATPMDKDIPRSYKRQAYEPPARLRR